LRMNPLTQANLLSALAGLLLAGLLLRRRGA
jgi:hypothetical protein